MLFAAGWGYGHYSRMNPWKTGLAMLAAGGVLGVTAILLEK
jgi:VIT1/CCC1 family predicted Fe2+/Mn2+ transporter